MTKKQKKEQSRLAIESLKSFVKKGDTIYTIMTHVSSSGMSRRFRVLHCINNEAYDISNAVANALEWRTKRNWEIVVSGCGMDMSYHLVSRLSYVLGYNTGTPDGETNCYGLNHKNI